MGATVSNVLDNDDLVDNLIRLKCIKTKRVEQVFRAVDRADYVLPPHRKDAYKDLAWKDGNFHLSAPCVYGVVMETLALEPGLSFLNLGSGTGYLNTMAGLILSQNGTNHGIELHEDCIKYAYERLDEFKKKSLALDVFDFCEPLFIQGNCLNIVPSRQYDRVYCNAACPRSYKEFLKEFVRVGGILVMPFEERLLCLERVDENFWLRAPVLPVSFANLVIPGPGEQAIVHLPSCNPLSLQELCRGKIRNRLRHNVWREHAELETKEPVQADKGNYEVKVSGTERLIRIMSAFIGPQPPTAERSTAFSLEDSSESESDSDSESEQEASRVPPKKVAKRKKTDSGIVEDVNLSNDRGSSSSNTNRSVDDPSETMDAMDVDLSTATGDITPPTEVIYTHYVDRNAFSNYMKEKIQRLPLPFSLKLYINYNRELYDE